MGGLKPRVTLRHKGCADRVSAVGSEIEYTGPMPEPGEFWELNPGWHFRAGYRDLAVLRAVNPGDFYWNDDPLRFVMIASRPDASGMLTVIHVDTVYQWSLSVMRRLSRMLEPQT